jgi:phospholipid/cholesterol/gamma-HCH transport system permease protein
MSEIPSGSPPALARLRRSFADLGELTLLFGAALIGSFRRPFYWQELLEQCRTVLFANFVPILLTGTGLGFFVSIEAGQFFRAFSSLYRLGGFEVMSNIRELAPVSTGLMIAGVSGTAIIADLGARQVRSELDALSVMGMSNVLFIVVPRALALMLMTALYNLPMIAFMMISGFLAGHLLLGVNTGGYLASFWTQGTVVDVVSGEVKCVLFGAIVAAICIYKGVTAKGGAEGVARAVHSGVVWCFVSISVFEYLFTPTILALFHTQLTLR